MMDYVVHQSSITVPATAGGWRSTQRSNGQNWAVQSLSSSMDNKSSAASSWVGVYSSGTSSIVITAPRKPVSTYKVANPTSRQSEKLQRLEECLDFIYCNDLAALEDPEQSRVALRGVIDAVEDLSDARDYRVLDDLLALVKVDRLRTMTAVAFLRSSFACRERLRNWNGLYQVVYAHLANSGENPARALRGMPAPSLGRLA
jgi:hypothetical protein